MSKTIDFRKTVLELSQQDPDFLVTMKELGFHDIANPVMLRTAGRFMTLPKGARMKEISMEKVREAFEAKGYQIVE